MELLIDASNIKTGGGLTHLKELINHASDQQLKNIEVLTREATAKQLPRTVSKTIVEELSSGFLNHIVWRLFKRKKQLRKFDMVFTVGGGKVKGRPYITMCQNLLPLEVKEHNRFFPSLNWLRYKLLRNTYLQSYQESEGVIFLNEYSYRILPESVKTNISSYSIIPHGINKRFFKERKSYVCTTPPFKLIYVSIINLYKHQWIVAEAVLQLRAEGYPMELHLVGPKNEKAWKKLSKILSKYSDDEGVSYHGKIPYEELDRMYENMDAAIYASTCETFGMTLLEAMAAALPIACSNQSSMPEMLKDAGVYFDPEEVESTKRAILKLYHSEEIRQTLGQKAQAYARQYDWKQTTEKTFEYLEKVAKRIA